MHAKNDKLMAAVGPKEIRRKMLAGQPVAKTIFLIRKIQYNSVQQRIFLFTIA